MFCVEREAEVDEYIFLLKKIENKFLILICGWPDLLYVFEGKHLDFFLIVSYW